MIRLKSFILKLVRTVISMAICIFLLLYSGIIIDFFPSMFLVGVIPGYYYLTMLFYYVISSEDILSTFLGILLSICFFLLYLINININPSIFVKGLYFVGLIIGIAQTFKSTKLRINNKFRSEII